MNRLCNKNLQIFNFSVTTASIKPAVESSIVAYENSNADCRRDETWKSLTFTWIWHSPQAPIYALLKNASEMVEMCEDARRKITSPPPIGGISGH